MADNPIEQLGGKTPLQYANTPYMDLLAKNGRTGRLVTVPAGYSPGSEVANTAILGYDLDKVYEGRGPLEAASIGYDMDPMDMAIRCNIISVTPEGTIKTHNGGNLSTEDAGPLIDLLNEKLGSDKVRFIRGIQYRHLLVIKGGSKYKDDGTGDGRPAQRLDTEVIRHTASGTPQPEACSRRQGLGKHHLAMEWGIPS